MSCNLDDRVVVASETLINIVGGQAYLLHLQTQETFQLSTIGTRMWGLLVSSKSMREAVERFAAETSTDITQVERDLLEMVRQLHQRRFIELQSEQPST